MIKTFLHTKLITTRVVPILVMAPSVQPLGILMLMKFAVNILIRLQYKAYPSMLQIQRVAWLGHLQPCLDFRSSKLPNVKHKHV